MPVQVGTGFVDIRPDLSGFGRQLKTEVSRGVAGAGDDAGRSLKTSLTGAVKGAAAAFGAAFAAVKVRDFLGGAIQASSDLNESLSKSNNVFKGSAAEIDAWSKTAAAGFGLSRQQALESVSTFGNMFAQLGIGGEQAATMSEKIVQLAADFASFHNANIEDVLTAQSAAFRGEYDALQRYLPLVTAATVEQRALALTGKRTTKELTAQDKALAVNALMYEGAGDAAGDFARTSDGLANQQRIMNAQWADAKAELGDGLIPIMKSLAQIMNDTIIPAFKTFFLSEGADATGWASTLREVVGDTVGFLVQAFGGLARLVANVISAIPGGWGEGAADNLRAVADGADGMARTLHASTAELLTWKEAAGGASATGTLFGSVIKGFLPDLKASAGVIGGSAAATRELGKATRDAGAADRDLRDARKDLAKLIATHGVDEEKVAAARQSLADATRSAAHADRELAGAQRDYDEALAAANILGTDTSKENLADAANNLADATDSSASAHENATAAALALADAQKGDPDFQDKLADARDRVADATDRIATTSDALTKLTPALIGGLNGTTGAINGTKDAAHGLNTELTFTKQNITDILNLGNGGLLGPTEIGPPTDISPQEFANRTRGWGGVPASTTSTAVQVDMTVLGPAPDPGLLGKAIAWVI